MSTASADTSSDQPQRTSHQPGPLTILAATAIGGVLATRMGKTPFLLAAGAAAIALLNQKKVVTPAPLPLSLPPPAPPAPAQSQVEQWLSRQILREEQAPVVEISTTDVTPDEHEEDYQPESFLLDDADEFFSARPDNDSFASLSEPMPQPITEPAPELEPEVPVPPSQVFEIPIAAPAPYSALSAFAAPTPIAAPALTAADSAWTLGVEPLPSLNESGPYVAPAGSMYFSTPMRQESRAPEPPRSSMFSSAPIQQEDPGPPLFFSTSVFEGAAFPDEISVAPTPEPVAPPAAPAPADVAVPAPEPEPLNEPAAETAQEIQVEFAAPGDASFDPPLAAAPQNPWQHEKEVFATAPAFPAFPTQTQTTGTVVEAEIILRPRAPTQNIVTAKSKFAPPTFSKHFPAESNDSPPAEGTSDAHFPGPLPSPHEPKSRPTWRSWWRGD